jgi:hypothetical protein
MHSQNHIKLIYPVSDYILMDQRMYPYFKQYIVVQYNTVVPGYVLGGQYLTVKQNRVPFVAVNQMSYHEMSRIYSTEVLLFLAVTPGHMMHFSHHSKSLKILSWWRIIAHIAIHEESLPLPCYCGTCQNGANVCMYVHGDRFKK